MRTTAHIVTLSAATNLEATTNGNGSQPSQQLDIGLIAQLMCVHVADATQFQCNRYTYRINRLITPATALIDLELFDRAAAQETGLPWTL